MQETATKPVTMSSEEAQQKADGLVKYVASRPDLRDEHLEVVEGIRDDIYFGKLPNSADDYNPEEALQHYIDLLTGRTQGEATFGIASASDEVRDHGAKVQARAHRVAKDLSQLGRPLQITLDKHGVLITEEDKRRYRERTEVDIHK